MTEKTPQQGRPNSLREFDDLYQHVNSFGRYQIILFICTNMLAFPVSSQFAALVFAFGAPEFHCTTTSVTCPPRKCCDGCTSYAFDGPFDSVWNLICDRAYLAATVQSCFFVGMLLGSFVTGMISDAWGRKKCIFGCNAIMLASGVGSCFANSIIVLTALRFILGFGLTGVMLALYIYDLELVGPTRRTAVGNLTYVFYNTFSILDVLISYLVPDWRMFLLAITVPAVLLFPFWRLVPESPRWLIAHNQLDEAHRVLTKYGGKKDKPLDSKLLRTLIVDVRKDQIEREKQAKKYTPIDLFRTPKLRKWTAIACYQWFVVAFVSFGILLFLTQLSGNVYVNFVIMKIATLLRIPGTWFIFLKFGRRISHGVLITSVGVALLLVLAFYKDTPMATTVLSLLGLILIDCNWTGVYLITSELFPTMLSTKNKASMFEAPVSFKHALGLIATICLLMSSFFTHIVLTFYCRNTAQGTGSTSARIGGILSPYVAMMGQLPGLSIAFPVTIFGVVALLAGVLMYWLPETLFSPMHQTVEAAESAEDDYSIPCCGRKSEQAKEREMDVVDAVL